MSAESALGARLRARGWPWAGSIELHPTLGSTSDRLKDLARGGAPEGSVVLADAQTAGHGRQGRSWLSPAGNLHVSILFRPPAAVPLLPLAAGVAVAEAVQELGVDARLKWPNDVMIGERKLGGILTQASAGGLGLEWVVLGIGLNVGVAPGPDLAPSAISLSEAAGRAASVEDAATAVLARVAVWYHRLLDGGSGPVLNAWRERALPWWGERVSAWAGEGPVEGRAIGLDEEGGLILELDDGSRSTLRSGEVTRVRSGDR